MRRKRHTATRFAVIDTETTGLSKHDRIVEFACITISNGEIVDEYDTLIQPNRRSRTQTFGTASYLTRWVNWASRLAGKKNPAHKGPGGLSRNVTRSCQMPQRFLQYGQSVILCCPRDLPHPEARNPGSSVITGSQLTEQVDPEIAAISVPSNHGPARLVLGCVGCSGRGGGDGGVCI